MIFAAGASVAAGILTTLSPCVLPLLPIVLASAKNAHRFAPIALSMGLAVSFATVGVLVSSFGSVLGINPEILRKIMAGMLILMGVSMVIPALHRLFERGLSPVALKVGQWTHQLPGTSLAAQFLIGASLGIVWSPCSGPTLGAAISLAAGQNQMGAFFSMLLFGLGAAIPLLLLSTGASRWFLNNRNSLLKRSQFMKRSLGITLFATGLLILTGADKSLETFFVQLAPEWYLNLTTLL